MEDGKTPADFDYNAQVTREVVEMAHERGVTVEEMAERYATEGHKLTAT